MSIEKKTIKSDEQLILLYRRLRDLKLDANFYKDEYISAFFEHPLLTKLKLHGEPLRSAQVKAIQKLIMIFKLPAEYEQVLNTIANKIFAIAQFFNLIGAKYEVLIDQKRKMTQARKSLEKKLGSLGTTVKIGGVNELLALWDKKNGTQSDKKPLYTFGKLHSVVTTVLCRSILSYLNHVPMLDINGDLLASKDKIKLTGAILTLADWKFYENNGKTWHSHKFTTHPKRKVFNLDFSERSLEKTYKIIHTRLSRKH